LEKFLTFEFFTTAVFLNDHVRNFVDAFVGGKAAIALQAFAPAANQIASARFARVHYFVI
jgi:hypothetical protein